MSGYRTFWNYQIRKNGDIVISKEEMQAMLDQAYQSGYNQAVAEKQAALKKQPTLEDSKVKHQMYEAHAAHETAAPASKMPNWAPNPEELVDY